MIKRIIVLAASLYVLSAAAGQNPKKPVLYVPFDEPEFAYNLVKGCPAVDVTFVQDKANFAVSWGVNERENRNDWVLYAIEGKVVGSGETMRVSAAARDICNAIAPK